VFGGLRAGDPPGGAPAPPEPLRADTTTWKINEKGQVVVCLGFNGVSLGSPDRYALEVLDAVTSGVRLPGGWLHTALRGAEDLVYYVHLVPRWLPHSGHIAVIAQTSPENRQKVVDIVERELERAKRAKITPGEIAAARATCIAAQQLYHQDPASQAEQAARYELYGLGYAFLDDYASQIQQVTLDDIARVAEHYLGARVLAMTGPNEAFR
jgi:zinc protease